LERGKARERERGERAEEKTTQVHTGKRSRSFFQARGHLARTHAALDQLLLQLPNDQQQHSEGATRMAIAGKRR